MSTILQNTTKRDHLIEIQQEIQSQWQESRIFESNPDPSKPKYMATFPYPYMNGRLHLGHVFTISKAEFTIAYKLMKGFNCLFPFGFHCTGMPIVAASGKLKRELNEIGFDKLKHRVQHPEEYEIEDASASNPALKNKIAVKQGNVKYQFEILYSMGVDLNEIESFVDPYYWTTYFPPLATSDLVAFGAHIDWRRSFITTDANPYYDKFVHWQFNKLRRLNKIKFGLRYTIWSALDNGPCMDHDRQSGEGVGCLEYTCIKIKLVEPTKDLSALLESYPGIPVYFIAATLRPETMYGQTNCFISPTIQYSAYLMANHQIYICTERAAKNMSYQGQTTTKGQLSHLFDILGASLLGCSLSAPLSHYPIIYMLPLSHVLATKGTAVVTSVPSDSPDDFIMVSDLKKKPTFYNVQPEWIMDPISIISTPTSNLIASEACAQFKVKSPNDRDQLDKAKELAYKQGFYNGYMLVGEYKDVPVQIAKTKIRDLLIGQDLAFIYNEPEAKVVSRSGDECVVNLCDQWYLDYGEAEWRDLTKSLLSTMECYHPETRNLFDATLDWLNQWACARSFGLGTRLPWDKEYLVESLSDSTIYMAYYTIAHLFKDLNISSDELNDDVFEGIFGDGPLANKFKPLKHQFQYYYPFDLRVSGKDLVPNHLTFCIYNHSALFPKEYFPKSIRSNGHLMLNSLKMSKSTGNFMTLKDCIDKYGSDATRFTLADAGDLVEDANFMESTANSVILRLYTQLQWTQDIIKDINSLRTDKHYLDTIFLHMMNYYVLLADQSYDQIQFREALKYGFYELQDMRDWYSNACGLLNIKMNAEMISLFVKQQCLVMAPITSHLSEHIWQQVLGNKESVVKSKFPSPTDVNDVSIDIYNWMKMVIHGIGSQEATDIKRQKGAVQEGTRVLHLFHATAYPDWQMEAINALKSTFKNKEFDNTEKQVLGKLKLLKNKKVMPFVQLIKVLAN